MSRAQSEMGRVVRTRGTVRTDAWSAPPVCRQQRRGGGRQRDEGTKKTSVCCLTGRAFGAKRREPDCGSGRSEQDRGGQEGGQLVFRTSQNYE